MSIGSEQQGEAPRVIETASATTSPDNANSGSAAYVIAVVTVLVMLLLGGCTSGCVALMGPLVADEMGMHDGYGAESGYGNGVGYDNGTGYDHYLENLDELLDGDDLDYEKLIEHYLNEREGEGQDGQQGQGGTGSTGSSTVADLLASGSLYVYGNTIDSLLSASDYANAQEATREFVRGVVTTDKGANAQVIDVLRSAARGDRTTSEALAECQALAEKTAEELRGTSLPTVEGETATEASRDLELARTHAIARWDSIASEMKLLATSEEVAQADLTSAEQQIEEATESAAREFSSALKNATNY